MDIAIYTLGCKVNQVETQAMERELLGRGHRLVDFDGPADAYIVNTCTVTAVSDKKCRNIIRRARKRAPDGVVAVCGCYAQTGPEAVAALGADLVSGSAGRMAFLDRLEGLLKAKGYEECVAYIADGQCNVVVSGDLQDSDMLVVQEVVMEQTGLSAEKIKIIGSGKEQPVE